MFTVPVVYELIYEKILNPYDKISGFFNNLSSDITIIELLSHTSGFPAWLPIYEMVEKNLSLEERKKEVIKIISASRTNDRSKCYSDLNYILLGFIIEKITGKRLMPFLKILKKITI